MSCKSKCGPVSIGELRHRITFEDVVYSQDDTGGSSEVWAPFTTAWAKLTPKLGNERFFAGKVEHDYSHEAMMRYQDGLGTQMRVEFNGTRYQIKSIITIDETKEFMKLLLKENTAT